MWEREQISLCGRCASRHVCSEKSIRKDKKEKDENERERSFPLREDNPSSITFPLHRCSQQSTNERNTKLERKKKNHTIN